MNGLGAASTPRTSSESNSNSGWNLPCHIKSLILMNCKSRTEAFARSLHCKLRSLSQTNDDQTSQNVDLPMETDVESCNNDQDLGFCSPANDFHHENGFFTALEHNQLLGNGGGDESSGCVSSVSSVFTEQDNFDVDDDDDDPEELNNFGGINSYPSQQAITSQPVPNFFPVDNNYLCDLAKVFSSEQEQKQNYFDYGVSLGRRRRRSGGESGGCLPIAEIHKQDDLEQGRATINFQNSSQVVVDIEESNAGGTAEQTVVDVTLNKIIDDLYQMGINESELQIDSSSGHEENCEVNRRSVVKENQNSPVIPENNNVRLSLPKAEDETPVRVRRSSSLKTCKTPPGTPNHKKIVRFADAMGLDLEDVKTVFLDDLPVVPSSAFQDLESSAYMDDETGIEQQMIFACHNNGLYDFNCGGKPKTTLVPVFAQPGSLPDFFDRLRKQTVCLESAVVSGQSIIRLVVRVLNVDFHKSVVVRHTSDEWKTYQDVMAEYVDNSNDVFSDKFHTVITSYHLQVGGRLCLAISYKTQGKQFWDNNEGKNYIFQCFPEHDRQLSPSDDSWIHFQ